MQMKSHNQPINYLNQSTTTVTTRNSCFHISNLVLGWLYSAFKSWMGSRAACPNTLWDLKPGNETAGYHREDLLPLQSSGLWVKCSIWSGRKNKAPTGTAAGWREDICNAQRVGEERSSGGEVCRVTEHMTQLKALDPQCICWPHTHFVCVLDTYSIQGRYKKVWDIERNLRR